MIKTVTVLGANGTMGCNVSGIFASFGNAKVFMISRTMDKSYVAIERAAASVKADAIKINLIPADYSMLSSCINESDLIFESVAEDLNTKIDINHEIVKYAKENTIICTGTSGLSIKQLAEIYPEKMRKNYFGLHFFNPPYNMVLCELIPSVYTDRDMLTNMKTYISNTLHRTLVEVKDSPAFLGNRIGFQFINEALQYAEKYKDNGGIDYIDAILGQFTGRSMPPLATSDFVGLDVHKAIVDNIYENSCDYARDTFILPKFTINLINKGFLGRKSNGGLYKREVKESGVKRELVYDIASNVYRDKMEFRFPFSEKMIASLKIGDYKTAFDVLENNHSIEAEICLEFMLKYVIYALNTTALVGDRIQSADDVMATGFNWCPPLAMIQAFSGVGHFKKLVTERLSQKILNKINLDQLFENVGQSNYDYRIYFRAKS
jgi:3-hydroxyacyl-CoA dehydrogenase